MAIIKVDWSARQEATMYLCDYLVDKCWLWRTSDFDVTLVRWTSDIISLIRSLLWVVHSSLSTELLI